MTASGVSTRRQLNENEPFAEQLPQRLLVSRTPTRASGLPIRAAQIEKPIARVTVRDTKSRWGSCSARGCLSFSWRLVLAPESVVDYVVAHEVAHLAEMNHGPRFWRLVQSLTPDCAAPRAWLNRHRNQLLAYG